MIPSSSYSSLICASCDRKLSEIAEFQHVSVIKQLKLYQTFPQHPDEIKSEQRFIKAEPESDNEDRDYQETEMTAFVNPECLMFEDPTAEHRTDRQRLATGRIDKKKRTKSKILKRAIGFECSMCERKFVSRNYLESHMMRKHQLGDLQQAPELLEVQLASGKFPEENLCSICAKVIKKGKYGLTQHILHVHTGTFQYFCDLCPHKTKSLRYMANHMRTHIKKEFREKFVCEFCNAEFTLKKKKHHHILMQHTDMPKDFLCDCGKAFKTRESLGYHKSQVHQIGSFPCEFEECVDRVFPSKMKLLRHHRRVHGEKMACEICGKLCVGGRNMALHMRKHGEPSLKCPFEGCPKEFYDKNAVELHVQSKHSPTKDFECPTCGTAFSTMKNMKKHISRQHEFLAIKCQVDGCQHMFKRREYLIRHYTRHNGIDEVTRMELITKARHMKGIGW